MNMNATLLGQLICFILFVWFCMKFIWPPLINAIEKRQKEISESLTSAEQAKKELSLANDSTHKLLQEAKAQAQSIVDQANKRKAQMIEEAKVQAQSEKEKIISQGLAEVESERKKAQEMLRKQMAQLVVTGAEKVIQRSVDEAANSDIVDQMIAQL